MKFWNRKKEKSKEKYKEIPYQHLAPIDSVDDKTTFDALDYALSQNNIHNVALTGNYGAGKSSILESYIKQKNKCNFLKGLFKRIAKKKKIFLKISLATFAIEIDAESDNQNETIPQTTAQEIEKSILQQIFYRKSGKKFPYSHFSRIKKVSTFRKILTEIVILIAILIPLYVVKGNLYSLVKAQFSATPDTFDLILVSLCLVAFLVIFYKVISLAYKLRLAKFSFQDAEIEFDENKKEESLLNKYLDELLYFFEVTNFNVVIFEDLDRFRNTEIFIKLRELNTLLNNYEKIHRRIVFIYALRDEVFKDCSRTKFFDFIIPVIPVINNQNSSDMLLNQWKENKDSPLGKIDESFLKDVGLYVDDMRLLKNSINEFKIYDKKVNEEDYKENNNETDGKICRDRNKIFALILYKNLYPNDFALLAQNKGELYSIFQKKKIVAEKETPALYQVIKQIEENLEKLKRQILLDINELRVVYVAKIFSKKPENYYVDRSIYDYISNEEFEKIQQGAAILCVNRYGYGNRDYISYRFSDIEKEVCAQYSYNQREKMLMDLNSGKIENLKKQLAEKKALLSGIQQMSIAEMIDEFTPDQFVTDVKNIKKDFIIYLLRNSFIDENYFDYISYFYANSLSEDETQYLLLIKNQQNPNFALLVKNSNFSNVIARIKYNEWKLPAVLNYSVLYCILLFDDSHIDVFLRALWNYKRFNRNSLFLSKFRAEPSIQSKLYCRLYSLFSTEKDWFITLFDDEESIVVYKFFVAVNFKKTENDIITFLTKDMSFLRRADVDCSTVASKINYYGLKFNLLEDTVKYPIYNIILDNNAYVISKHNFDVIIKNAFADAVGKPIKDYYTRVSRLQNQNIKAYIDQNIEIFVKNVVLSTGEPIAESEDSFVELLNNNTLLMEIKIELIEKNDCVISDITKIKLAEVKLANANEKFVDIRNLLFKHKKVSPIWSNIFENFKANGNKIDDCLVDYLNDEKNVKELVKTAPLTNENVDSENDNIASVFYSAVLDSNHLSIKCFSDLMEVCPRKYEKINYDIESGKIDILVEQEKLVFTQENYIGIKQNHVNLLPKFIATYFDDFVDKWNVLEIEITFDDMKIFLDSRELSKEQKYKLLSSDFDIWYAVSQQDDALTWLGRKILELNLDGKVQVPISSVVANMDDADDVLKLLCLQGRNLNENEITDVISNKLDESYCLCIKRDGKREKLPNTGLNKELCAILSEKGIISSYQEDGKKIKVIQKRM